MCGILGIVKKKSSEISEISFSERLNKIRHRGPDDSGIFENEFISLGSVRLAIQDLSHNGHMPMFSKDKSKVIIFNGEIYNYLEIKKHLLNHGVEFFSNTDTEVLLNAYQYWGVNFINKIEGMFAFCIYDISVNKLFLYRDRVGEKPLYFKVTESYFAFGSEVKVLLDFKNESNYLNRESFINYLHYGFGIPTNSMFDNIWKLEPGCTLIYDLSAHNYHKERYWSLPTKINKVVYDEIEHIERLDTLLSDSVRKTLISDVPIGVLLSGGLDSSLITAYAAESYNGRLKTFNISFEGFGKYDESAFASLVSRHFDTEHFILSGNDIKYDLINTVCDYFDEPLADSSILPTFIVCELTKKEVSVALGGDGGDELFGGYTNYARSFKLNKLKNNIPSVFKSSIGSISEILPLGFKGKNFMSQLSSDGFSDFYQPRFFSNYTIAHLLDRDFKNEVSQYYLNDFEQNSITNDPLDDFTRYDFGNYLVEDILCKIDRASMAHSLELRAPWLDKSILEYAFSCVPSQLMLRNSILKYLPKRLAERKLPKDLMINRKQGFSIPIDKMIATSWFEEVRGDINSLPDSIFDISYANDILNSIKKGRSNAHLIFSLVMFSKWFNKYNVKSN